MANILSRIVAAIRKPNVVDVVTPTINIIDRSTLLDDKDFQLMVEACKIQLEQHVAPMWLRGSWNIVVNQPEEVGYPIVIVDDPDQAGVLGYHTKSPCGKVWGRVFVKSIIEGKGLMLNGPLSVSAILTHEVIEAYCDPDVNIWADRGDGFLIAYEACDPVEDDVYDITTKSGVKVSVSNFVLPAWFDPRAPEGAKLDFMAKLTKPFTTSTGGYFVMRHPKTGETKNIYGSSNAASMHAMRQAPHPAARSTRKIST
jgi:hypothetical protein